MAQGVRSGQGRQQDEWCSECGIRRAYAYNMCRRCYEKQRELEQKGVRCDCGQLAIVTITTRFVVENEIVKAKMPLCRECERRENEQEQLRGYDRDSIDEPVEYFQHGHIRRDGSELGERIIFALDYGYANYE
jgi:hypothetical protein